MKKTRLGRIGECENLRKLGAFMDCLGSGRLGLLIDMIPNIDWYLSDPDDIPERYRSLMDKIFDMWNIKEITQEHNINLSLVAAYSVNAEERWRENIGLLTFGELPNGKKDTHKGIDYQAYLEMLNARHLAAIPWMTEPFLKGEFASVVDLGGGAGTLIRILKEQDIVEKGYLVDRPDMTERFTESRFSSNADSVITGDITDYKTWLDILKLVEMPSLWVISDVLHGRSVSNRGKIYSNISNLLLTSLMVEERFKYTIPTIYIREFMGFSLLDAFLFDMQLRLFTQGQLLTFDELRAELKKSKLCYQYDVNTSLYYYGPVIREELVEHHEK